MYFTSAFRSEVAFQVPNAQIQKPSLTILACNAPYSRGPSSYHYFCKRGPIRMLPRTLRLKRAISSLVASMAVGIMSTIMMLNKTILITRYFSLQVHPLGPSISSCTPSDPSRFTSFSFAPRYKIGTTRGCLLSRGLATAREANRTTEIYCRDSIVIKG